MNSMFALRSVRELTFIDHTCCTRTVLGAYKCYFISFSSYLVMKSLFSSFEVSTHFIGQTSHLAPSICRRTDRGILQVNTGDIPVLGLWTKCKHSTLSSRIRTFTMLLLLLFLIWNCSIIQTPWAPPSLDLQWLNLLSTALNAFIEPSCLFHRITIREQRLPVFSPTATQRSSLEWFHIFWRCYESVLECFGGLKSKC